MKNRAIMKKFRMRIGVVLFMVLIMLMGSCLSELRFSALAMDTASEALAETSREEAPLPSSSMLQPEPVVTPEPKENIPAATQPPVPEGGQEGAPAGGEETNVETPAATQPPVPEGGQEEDPAGGEEMNVETPAAVSYTHLCLGGALLLSR